MKLRICGKNLRLRLSASEVCQFAATGRVEDQVSFGAKRLSYALQSSPRHPRLTADLVLDSITVFVPSAEGLTWAETELVSLRDTSMNDGRPSLLVEKDFPCKSVC